MNNYFYFFILLLLFYNLKTLLFLTLKIYISNTKMFAFKKILVLVFTLSSSIINSTSLLYCDARPICKNLSHQHAQYAQQSVNSLHASNDIKYIPNLSKASITNSYNTHIYPVVLLHGIISDHTELLPVVKWLEANTPNPVFNLDIGNGKVDSILKPMAWQLDELCDTIYEIEELRGGFHFIGMSQGGILARAYVEKCNYFPVINLITWVSPHAGVYGLGNIDNINLKRIYTPLYQQMYSFAGYFKDPFRYKEYLQMASFLPDLNNEIVNYNTINNINTRDYNDDNNEANALFNYIFNFENNRNNMLSLQNFVMIWSSEDEILNPPASAMFSFFEINDNKYKNIADIYNFTANTRDVMDILGFQLPVIDLFDSVQFKDDLIGLKTLWQTGRLHIFQTNCTHAGHKTEACFPQMENLTFPFLF